LLKTATNGTGATEKLTNYFSGQFSNGRNQSGI